jgi:GntR family transcriptional regulator
LGVLLANAAQAQQTKTSNIPAYRQIQDSVIKRIESGELKSGDAVDSERNLARVHGVSLMTARHALVALEREGLVERRRGAGTFVAPPKIHFNKLMSFTEQLAGRGLTATSKIIACKQVSDEPEIAARLSLSSSSRLIKIERLRYGANEPFALETCYLSADEFKGLDQASLARSSLFTRLENEYGVVIAHADEDIDATTADPAVARLLAIPRQFPLLRIRQTIYSTKGKAITYVLGLYRADRHMLRIRRFR